MSNCVRDLYYYELVKKCSKCGKISLKSNFHKDLKRNDGIFWQCKLYRKVYRKKYYEEKIDLEIIKQRI